MVFRYGTGHGRWSHRGLGTGPPTQTGWLHSHDLVWGRSIDLRAVSSRRRFAIDAPVTLPATPAGIPGAGGPRFFQPLPGGRCPMASRRRCFSENLRLSPCPMKDSQATPLRQSGCRNRHIKRRQSSERGDKGGLAPSPPCRAARQPARDVRFSAEKPIAPIFHDRHSSHSFVEFPREKSRP